MRRTRISPGHDDVDTLIAGPPVGRGMDHCRSMRAASVACPMGEIDIACDQASSDARHARRCPALSRQRPRCVGALTVGQIDDIHVGPIASARPVIRTIARFLAALIHPPWYSRRRTPSSPRSCGRASCAARHGNRVRTGRFDARRGHGLPDGGTLRQAPPDPAGLPHRL